MGPRPLLSNVSWNIAAGLSAAAVNVALPPILSRLLPAETFGAWAFCLQVAGYIMLLNLGLQVIVGRFVANAEATQDRLMRDEIVASAFALLSVAGLIGIFLLWIVGRNLHALVPDASVALQAEMGIALLLLSLSFALMLPTSVMGSVFIGLRRNGLFAATVMPMRAATFAAVLVVCWLTRDIVSMAAGWLAAVAAGSLMAVWIWRRWCPQPRLSLRLVSRQRLRQLLEPALVVSLWNLAGLFIAGLQVVLVARFDYASLGAFASASALAMFLSGVAQAVASATVPEFAHLHAKEEGAQLIGLLTRATRYNVAFGALLCLPLIVAAPLFMQIWAGHAYTAGSGLLLTTLVCAQFVRNAMLIYSYACLAIGLQGKIVAVPLTEAATSFGLACLLAPSYGALGVAFAWVAASILAVLLHLAQNVLGRHEPLFQRSSFLLRALLRPAVGAIVAFAAIYGIDLLGYAPSLLVQGLIFVLSVMLTLLAGLGWKDVSALSRGLYAACNMPLRRQKS